MIQVNIEGVGSFEVPEGKRLVNALTDECGQDQLHSCGGQAKCTTCRVEFVSGEPNKITDAESAVLAAKGLADLPGVRLSCQILCEADMTLKVISRFAGSGKKDSGARPADQIEPPPVFAVKA
jgi:ferredoxin